MKPRVYLETSVLSYLAARRSRDHLSQVRQDITRRWWDEQRDNHEIVVSDAVAAECQRGDAEQVARRQRLLKGIPILPLNDAILVLAEAFIVPGGIPPTAAPDSVHVASAVHYQCDYLLTWNMRHIANAHIRRTLETIIERKGHVKPTICTPEELF